MRRRYAARLVPAGLALAGLALAGVGCVSLKRTPEARFFVLRSLAEPPAAAAPGVAPGLVGVLPVRLPGYLDRPQLVVWKTADEVEIDEFLRWAEPIDVGVTRTLAENLDALLPEHRVIRSPWPAAAKVEWRVRVDLRRFGPQDGGEVRLDGRWVLLPGQGERPLVTHETSLKRGPFVFGRGGQGAAAGVEAMSDLVAELSREIASALRALPASDPAS